MLMFLALMAVPMRPAVVGVILPMVTRMIYIPAPKHRNRKAATKKSKATLRTAVPVVDVNGAEPHNEESLPNVLDIPP